MTVTATLLRPPDSTTRDRGSHPSSCHRNGGNQPVISKWGGPRANSGGARPGAGRKPKPVIVPTLAVEQWCVIAFFGQAEISATRELSRQGYETYLPLVAIRRRDPVITSHWHTVRVPLLPGYGFLRMTTTESREPIQATRGVREVLRRPDGRAARVPDAEIAQLLLGEEARLQLSTESRPFLKVGTRVRVEEGAFSTFPGTVLECDGVKTRVEIEIFGRLTPAWLDRIAVVAI